ncbi:hypothetical protein I8748_16125 [Nostoc sp. CENA67]|uniref:Uncharacterized protein n=1 Tax=Amazonocrinis nigriterrae CENA67 TaxID=2794033 RepID=A0A8J7HT79_9NOST|nr:hypothetical protein [Amazonocrinis nigriterrae]MBH8563700.1 hypothetical protein [Amazonocrinis nigriterrae CENA67]
MLSAELKPSFFKALSNQYCPNTSGYGYINQPKFTVTSVKGLVDCVKMELAHTNSP